MRVEIRIPGGVEAYAIPSVITSDNSDSSESIRIEMTDNLWKETFVSATLRALNAERDSPAFPRLLLSTKEHPLSAMHRQTAMALTLKIQNPFPTAASEKQFLLAARELFPIGWKLGNARGYDGVSLADNHLCQTINNYFNVIILLLLCYTIIIS